jgi:DNA-binding NarL/FixJ family response regulator
MEGVRVLVRMESDDLKIVKKMLQMGCMGLLYGAPRLALLRRAVKAVASGEVWASRRMLSQLIQNCLPRDDNQLTTREAEILRLIGLGYKNRDIAEQLFISRETVRWHIRALNAKIGAADRRTAVSYAQWIDNGQRLQVAVGSSRELERSS